MHNNSTRQLINGFLQDSIRGDALNKFLNFSSGVLGLQLGLFLQDPKESKRLVADLFSLQLDLSVAPFFSCFQVVCYLAVMLVEEELREIEELHGI